VRAWWLGLLLERVTLELVVELTPALGAALTLELDRLLAVDASVHVLLLG